MNSLPKVSLVMTTHNRAKLLANTLESIFRQEFNDYEVVIVDDGNDDDTPLVANNWRLITGLDRNRIQYTRLNRQKPKGYGNPAYPNNVGIRQAKGEIIILQNAECRHDGQEVIKSLADLTGTNNAVFAQVEALHEHGGGTGWYTHPQHNTRPFFFCGALHKEWFDKLRGFDEDYVYYGFDDNDMADRLSVSGVDFDFTNIRVSHQWHHSSYDPNDKNNALPALIYARKTREMAEGKVTAVRNLNREWGAL